MSLTMVTIEIDDLPNHVGAELGRSGERLITQKQVDLFAEATGDHQWIHVDPERARGGPFGRTIAHGYLSLSLVPSLLFECLQVTGARLTVNYGANRVRSQPRCPWVSACTWRPASTRSSRCRVATSSSSVLSSRSSVRTSHRQSARCATTSTPDKHPQEGSALELAAREISAGADGPRTGARWTAASEAS